MLSALGISAVGLGLLNRTGSTSGTGTAGTTAGGSEPGVQSSEPARRREEGDGGEGGTDGAYYNDDPFKGLTTDELSEKNSLQEKYDSGNASEEEMNRLSFLSTIDSIARYGDSVAESSGNLPVRDLRLEITKIRLGEDAGKASFSLIPEYLQGFQETLTAEKKIQLFADPELKKLLEVMPDLSKDGLNDIIIRASVKSETVLSYLVKNYGSELGSIQSMREGLILHFIEEISKRNFEMNWMLAERNLPENKKIPVSASKIGDTLLSGQTVNPMTGMFGGTINVSDIFLSPQRVHYAIDIQNTGTAHIAFDGKVIETGTGSTTLIDGVVRGIWEENGKVYYLDNNSQQTELLSPIDRSGGLSVLGNYIKVQSSQYGFSFTTTYAHLEKPYTGGENSTIFQPIGKTGMTGKTTGPHLHLAIQLNTIPSDIDKSKIRNEGGKNFVDPVYFMNYYLPMRQKAYTNLNDYINSRGK